MRYRDFKPYKPRNRRPLLRKRYLVGAGGAGLIGLALSGFISPAEPRTSAGVFEATERINHTGFSPSNAALSIPLPLPARADAPSLKAESEPVNVIVEVKKGDTLSGIFTRLKRLSDLLDLMRSPEANDLATRIMPGDRLRLISQNGSLIELDYLPRGATPLAFVRKDGTFYMAGAPSHMERRIYYAYGRIQNSLFEDGHRAGLSDKLIMQLARIFGWDIDFALDLRQGDYFTVVYDTVYDHGDRVGEGNILAAEFVNRGQRFVAIRYTTPDGQSGYYTPEGRSLRKAFLRTPVQFSYISSRFNLHRKHPILNRIRAHKGVDYAAPIGTPVRAAGDGKVAFVGWKGGYGRFIVLQHGQTYSTAYGHLSRFASGLRIGKTVKQGQVIGYVGKSGLATGPHLHYEFRVNGRHQNPLTIKLPNALPIASKYLADFKTASAPLLAQLESYGTYQQKLANQG